MRYAPERPDAGQWRRFCEADPRCTYFQTPSWLELVTRLDHGWSNATFLLRFDDGVEAILPRVTRPAAYGLFRRAESVPPGVYGGPIVRGGFLSSVDAALLARSFRGLRSADAALTEAPYCPLDLGVRRAVRTTHLLALGPEDTEDALLVRYRKGHRADVLRARRDGVTAALAGGDDDVEGYHRMYQETVARWERRPYMVYPLAFFRGLRERAAAGERVRIWLAWRDAELLAGVVVLVHGRHAAYWHAASTQTGRDVHAGHLALHAAILDAVGLGVTTFDFMPSAGLEAVERFKEGFAAAPAEIGVHHFPGSLPYRTLRRLKRSGPGA